MKPEKQRIAIAEACGWTCCGHVEGCHPHGLNPSRSVHDYSFKQVMDMEVPLDDLPDYLNDLNSMHEAEKVFSAEEMMLYACVNLKGSISNAVHATAAQRAEAFLRTIGKWEEEQ